MTARFLMFLRFWTTAGYFQPFFFGQGQVAENMIAAVRNAVGHGVRWKLRRYLEKTLHESSYCQEVQANTLSRILRLNGDSQFNSDYKLRGIATVEQFRRALPVADYSRAAPYVEQLKRGNFRALLGSRNFLRMFALTSGTTSSSKFIPVTSRFLRDYRRGWQVWGVRAFDDHPGLHGRTILQLCSNHDRFRTTSGVPCGNISGLVQRMQSRVVRSLYTVPPCAANVGDPMGRYYLALKASVISPGLGLITTANPSTVVQLFRMLEELSETLVRDLRDGTDSVLLDGNLPSRWRHLRRVERARELDALLEKRGVLHPRDVWPELQLVAVWTGGSAAAYLPTLREYLGDLPIRDHGLHASEGRMTIPLDSETPDGLLDIGSHFFEFIPESEIDCTNPIVLQAHELKEGENYFILLTTASGLYRYDIRDVVQCSGFLGTTPLLRFLHKGSHISNLTGEKLTESQVVEAVTGASQELDICLDFFTVTPEWGDPPRYVLLAGEHQLRNVDCAELARGVDAQLLENNSEYAEKRHTQRLEPLEIVPVPRSQWRQFIEDRQSTLGGSTEQYKHPFLVPRLEFLEEFQSRYLSDATTASAP